MISEIAKMAGEVAKQIAETQTSPTSGVESDPGKFEVPGTRDLGQTDDGPTGFDPKEIAKLADIEPDMTPVKELGLTDEEKAKLQDETGWSDKIVDAINSLEEAGVYEQADLQETKIGDKVCLIRKDIDMDQRDEFGRTNKERMENGQPPLTSNGETVELHHIGQKQDSPLAELTTQEHHGKGNDTVLHDKQKDSEINRSEFAKEREKHWENRVENKI